MLKVKLHTFESCRVSGFGIAPVVGVLGAVTRHNDDLKSWGGGVNEKKDKSKGLRLW